MINASNQNERGAILIWFYLLITMLLITGSGLYALAFQESRITTIEQSRNKAFYLAEAGLDKKLHELRTGNTANIPSTNIDSAISAAGTYSATYESANARVTATGTYGGVSRSVIAQIITIIPPGVKAAITSE